MLVWPGKTYTNFGFHDVRQSIVRGVSNSGFFNSLFGDSSFITTYMRYVGWQPKHGLSDRLEYGHRAGARQPASLQYRRRHDDSGRTNMINMQMSATSFRLAESKIGDNNFLGNGIPYPPNGPPEPTSCWAPRPSSDRRPGAREHRAARLTGLRDSTQSRPRSRLQRVVRRADASRPAAPEELAQFLYGLDLPCQPGRGNVCHVGARASRIRKLRSFRHLRVLRSVRGDHGRQHGLLNRARAGEHGLQATQTQLASVDDPYFWSHEKYWQYWLSRSWPCSPALRSRHVAACLRHEGRCQVVRCGAG